MSHISHIVQKDPLVPFQPIYCTVPTPTNKGMHFGPSITKPAISCIDTCALILPTLMLVIKDVFLVYQIPDEMHFKICVIPGYLTTKVKKLLDQRLELSLLLVQYPTDQTGSFKNVRSGIYFRITTPHSESISLDLSPRNKKLGPFFPFSFSLLSSSFSPPKTVRLTKRK